MVTDREEGGIVVAGVWLTRKPKLIRANAINLCSFIFSDDKKIASRIPVGPRVQRLVPVVAREKNDEKGQPEQAPKQAKQAAGTAQPKAH